MHTLAAATPQLVLLLALAATAAPTATQDTHPATAQAMAEEGLRCRGLACGPTGELLQQAPWGPLLVASATAGSAGRLLPLTWPRLCRRTAAGQQGRPCRTAAAALCCCLATRRPWGPWALAAQRPATARGSAAVPGSVGPSGAGALRRAGGSPAATCGCTPTRCLARSPAAAAVTSIQPCCCWP
ncbi:hypothetical protein COO60DRAFT_1510818 [Scenedesmus sp. NREL 46B-D3]|nr:hypothetical protein COO60DRAFT_1510818 [Scenedesmus sp. NREL 46B-D3]